MPKKKPKGSFKEMMNEARSGKSDKSASDDQRPPKFKAKKKKK